MDWSGESSLIFTAVAVADCVLVLTRSAQDFGVVFTNGDVGSGINPGNAETSSSLIWPIEPVALTNFEPIMGSVIFVASEAMLTDLRCDGREARVIFGIAGMIGSKGIVGLLKLLGLDTLAFWVNACAIADEGVVGCVESASEGGCDVTGVSGPESTGTGSSGRTSSWRAGDGSSEMLPASVDESSLGGSSTGAVDN